MVYNIHKKADKVSGVVKPDGRRKHCNRHRVSSEDKEKVLACIKPFTLVDQHYCKQKNKNKNKKKSLESGTSFCRKCMIFVKEIA